MKKTTLYTACITPMKSDGSIHYEDLGKVVRLQESAGNGLLLLGSTGEGLALSAKEKKAVVDHVVGMKVKVPIMVGVGGFNLDDQLSWITYCNGLEIDAFLLVTPLYAKPGVEGQTQWFNSLMDRAEKPCMIYNIPSRAGVELYVETLKRIENHEQFWSVKEASGSIEDYKEYRSECPDVPLFSGDDFLTTSFAEHGCSGLVSVSSNVWPEATNLYTKMCLDQQTEELSAVWEKAIEALFSAPNPVPAKVLMHEKGILSTNKLRAPLTADEMTSTKQLQEADSLIINWYKSHKS